MRQACYADGDAVRLTPITAIALSGRISHHDCWCTRPQWGAAPNGSWFNSFRRTRTFFAWGASAQWTSPLADSRNSDQNALTGTVLRLLAKHVVFAS